MGQCGRCGRECTGAYCDTCQFYVHNDQCWRCRMYLPRIELQQWRGQTYCPYCIMDIREEEKEREDSQGEAARKVRGQDGAPPAAPDETPFGTGQKNPDYECDRCKGDLDIVYVVADHKFCELCFNQQLRNWKKDGINPPPYMKFKGKSNPGLFSKLMAFLKHRIREEWEKRNRGPADRRPDGKR